MPDERYGICSSCRYCIHDEDDWACVLKSQVVKPGSKCQRYRPGSCENCSRGNLRFGEVTCSVDGSVHMAIDVCPEYDPCARNFVMPQ